MLNRENVVLEFALGFFALAFVAFFIGVSTQILTVLSLSSLLLAAAQIFENNLVIKNEERKMQLDELNQTKELNLDNKTISFLKKYQQVLFPTQKGKINQMIAKMLECASIVILVVGLAIPLQIFENENISGASTIGAFGCIFLSTWQIEKSRKKLHDLEYIQLFRENSEKLDFNILQKSDEASHNEQV